MKNGEVHSSEAKVGLTIFPKELRICGYTEVQYKVLANLLVQFVGELKAKKVSKNVIHRAFNLALIQMKDQ